MNKNMSGLDRGIRILVALVIAALYYYKIIEGTIGNVLLALSAIFLFTSFINFCPLYALFGLNTRKKDK